MVMVGIKIAKMHRQIIIHGDMTHIENDLRHPSSLSDSPAREQNSCAREF